jgi:arylsulfatase A-like enzyme
MMKRLIVIVMGMILGLGVFGATQPNVLVILADDLGYGDIGCYGYLKDFETPNIDRLAASGIRFTDGYVTAPQCGPSRAGLISGVFQDRFGYNDIINQGGLPPKSVLLTLPEQMKRFGYATGMAGKWHIGYKNPGHVHPPEEDNAPWLRGFDYVVMHDSGMSHYYNYSGEGAQWNLWRGIDNRYLRKRENEKEPNFIEEMEPDIYMTDYLTDEARAFIRRHKNEPWVFYLAYNAPHTPMVAKPEKLAKYSHLSGTRRVLAARMDSMDEGVGKVVEEIRATGQAENTMVWFLSDNGGETPHNGSLNGPLAGRKGHLFEGGIRVPFIVAFPGTLPAGKVEQEPISSLDILPTAMVLAGAESVPEIYDGHNVIPWLTGKAEYPSKELFWSFWGNYALRMGDFKEVRSKRNDAKTADGRSVPGHSFSNIRKNPGEDPDDPLESPERKQLLASRLDQRLVQLKDDQQKLTPVFSPAFQKKVDDRKAQNQAAALMGGQWVRIDFEQIDSEARIAKDILIPPGTHGYYTEGCRVVDGVFGNGLRFDNGQSMTIGKTPATSEMKCGSPVTSCFWVKLEANPDGLDTLIDMTDNTRPIKDSGFGYRLQVNPGRMLVFSLKSADGKALTHTCEKTGALPLGQWHFIALRFSNENEISITVLNELDAGKGPPVIEKRSEVLPASGHLIYTGTMLPRVGSNADASGSFLQGSIDEIGLVRGWMSDKALFDAYVRMME